MEVKHGLIPEVTGAATLSRRSAPIVHCLSTMTAGLRIPHITV